MDISEQATKAHTPVTLMALFANAFKIDPGGDILWLKGVFQDRQRGSYTGYYFDRLKDQTSGQIMTLKIPEPIKQTLRDGGLYLFKGYLDKDIRPDGVIEPVFVVAELASRLTVNASVETTTRADLQRQKAAAGYRNLDRLLEEKLRAGRRPRIALIYGKTSVVHEDVNSALKRAKAKYELTERRIDLLSRGNIVRALAECNSEAYDAVAVVRGGGAGLEIFDDVRIAKVAVNLQPLLITAIGHATDVTLLHQVADRQFTTPTALGFYLRETVERGEGGREGPDSSDLIALALLALGLILGIILSQWLL